MGIAGKIYEAVNDMPDSRAAKGTQNNRKTCTQPEAPRDVVGNTLVVAYETSKPGLKPAGIDLIDVAVPENPRLI